MILVVRRGGLGDTLLMLPVLRALRRRRSVARADGSAAPLCLAGVLEFAAVLESYGAVDRAVSSEDLQLWVTDPARLSPGARALWDAAQVVVADDVAARRLAPHAEVLVFDPRPQRDDVPIAQQWLSQLGLERLGLGPAAATATGTEHCAQSAPDVRLLAERAAFDPRAVALAPGSGGARKCWPRERWLALAQALALRGRDLAVVVGPAEHERDDPRRWPWPAPVRWLDGLSVPDLAAALASHAAFVGNDSGTTHLAAVLAVPTIAIFGPSNPRVFAPQGPHVRVVGSPTVGPPDASVEQVLAALDVDRPK